MKQLDKQDLERLLSLQKANKDLIEEFGKIGILETNLETRREAAVDFLTQLKEQEKLISKNLEEKYGKGTVDLDKGIFIPLT